MITNTKWLIMMLTNQEMFPLAIDFARIKPYMLINIDETSMSKQHHELKARFKCNLLDLVFEPSSRFTPAKCNK